MRKRLRVDAEVFETVKIFLRFLNLSGYVWTGPEFHYRFSIQKRHDLRFAKKHNFWLANEKKSQIITPPSSRKPVQINGYLVRIYCLLLSYYLHTDNHHQMCNILIWPEILNKIDCVGITDCSMKIMESSKDPKIRVAKKE